MVNKRDLIRLLKDIIEDEFSIKSSNMPDSYKRALNVTVTDNGIEAELDFNGPNGEPLGYWFEVGTDGHFIKPKDPSGVLTWTEGGNRYYSKGHYVRGIEGKFIIEKTLNAVKRRFIKEAKEIGHSRKH